MEIKIVWINKVNPMARGWESCVNKTDKVRSKGVVNIKMSENSLKKILVLGIEDKVLAFSLKF